MIKSQHGYLFTFVVLFFLTFSCKGYHHLEPASLSIPYIKEDLNGKLTSTLVQEVSSSGLFSYNSNHEGRFILYVDLLPSTQESIGYQILFSNLE